MNTELIIEEKAGPVCETETIGNEPPGELAELEDEAGAGNDLGDSSEKTETSKSRSNVPPPMEQKEGGSNRNSMYGDIKIATVNLKDQEGLTLDMCVTNQMPGDDRLNMSLRSFKVPEASLEEEQTGLLVQDLINKDDVEMLTEDGAQVVASTVVEISNDAHQARILCFDNRDKGGIEEYKLDFIHMKSGTQRPWSARNLICVRPADLKERAPIELSRSGGLMNRAKSCYLTMPQNPKKLFLYFVIRKPGRKLRLREIVMIFEGKHSVKNVKGTSIDKWLKMLKRFVKTNVKEQDRPTQLLAYLNPYGGRGRAKSIFQYKVMPLLWLAGIKVEAVHTQRADHAKDDVGIKADLDKYDGILSVGGDGMFNEVMTGLVMRYQSAAGKPMESCTVWTSLVRPDLRVGIIPAGSLNALCWSLHGTDDPVTAALHIVLGHTRRVDACGVYTEGKLSKLASTMIAFGYLGDALVKSERMRSVGPVRYRIAGGLAAMNNRHYGGLIDMEVVFDAVMDTPHVMNDAFAKGDEKVLPPCTALCQICADALRPTAPAGSKELEEITYNVSVTGMFPHIVGAVSICTSRLSPSGLAPSAHLGDGCMQLGLVGPMSFCRNIEFIRKTTLAGAEHLKYPESRIFKVRGFSFRPSIGDAGPSDSNLLNVEYLGHGLSMSREHVTFSQSSHEFANKNEGDTTNAKPKGKSKKERIGRWNIDGEIVMLSKEAMHFRVHQQLMNLFCEGVPPYESELRPCLRVPSCARTNGCINKKHHKISPAVDDYYF